MLQNSENAWAAQRASGRLMLKGRAAGGKCLGSDRDMQLPVVWLRCAQKVGLRIRQCAILPIFCLPQQEKLRQGRKAAVVRLNGFANSCKSEHPTSVISVGKDNPQLSGQPALGKTSEYRTFAAS
jgi:hypothetical protein